MRTNSPDSNPWELYQFPPSFVLGFHGCDKSVGEDVLASRTRLRPSQHDYDWLGSGICFWEANPQRALDFARQSVAGAKHSKGKVTKPFVLGAVIKLGICLDMRDSAAQFEVKNAYEALKSSGELPTNGATLKLRRLDCAVFNLLHDIREWVSNEPYDTVRATYREGNPLYPGTDLNDQDHTQICVRNPNSILGYFRPVLMEELLKASGSAP